MKFKELKSKSDEELNSTLSEMRGELIKHNTQINTGTTLKSPGQVKKTKKTIARIMTILNNMSNQSFRFKEQRNVFQKFLPIRIKLNFKNQGI